jgi:hypothetical protein
MKADNETPDEIITDLHKVRKNIVDSFNGDLVALTVDAEKRASESGRTIVDLRQRNAARSSKLNEK